MKKRYSIVMMLCSSLWLNAQNFIHPGMLHTQADLDRTKAKGSRRGALGFRLQETADQPACQFGLEGCSGRENRTRRPDDLGTRPGQLPVGLPDAATAYQCALVWHISGNKAYADKSVQILNAWAKTCKKVSGDTNACRHTGCIVTLVSPTLPRETYVRLSRGWDATDFGRFKEWMLKVWYHGVIGFLQGRNGTQDDHYWPNRGSCNVLCAMSIGISCDDVFIYNLSHGVL